jgi:hypothetical protein
MHGAWLGIERVFRWQVAGPREYAWSASVMVGVGQPPVTSWASARSSLA